MPRSKDTKVWNEDLTLAFAARAQQALAEGKCSTVGWNTAAEIIQEVCKDIYKAKTGRIYNLPDNKLGKNALALAFEIMAGTKSVLPDGHIPRNREQEEKVGHEGNWDSYPYLKKIKMRGGAYAILMAFHDSSTKTLSKSEICQLAQPYCDEDMDGDFHAGRMHGVWAANKTLLKHNLLVTAETTRRYIQGVGFRSNGCAQFTCTRDGELFAEAMIRKFGGGACEGAPVKYSTTVREPALVSPYAAIPPFMATHSPLRRTTHTVAELISPGKRSFSGTGHKLSTTSPAKEIRPTNAAGAAAIERAVIEESKRLATATPRSLVIKTDTVLRPDKEPAPSARRKIFHVVPTFVLEDSDDDIPPPSIFAMKNPPGIDRRKCFQASHIVDLADSETDCDSPSHSFRLAQKHSKTCHQRSSRVDLCTDARESNRNRFKVTPSDVICLDSDDDEKPAHIPKVFTNPYEKKNQSLIFCIDDRERVRNAAPRRLRSELNRLLETGCLKSVWPESAEKSPVNEVKLQYGDFSFLMGEFRLDVVVERKQIRDLVQRSTRGDHWNQLAKMRDNFRHAVFLIEVDPRESARFIAHGSQNLEGWNAFNTVIDDEKSFYLFMCRALLSHRSVKFIRTRDFQSSIRAVGALGMMAASLDLDMKEDPEQKAQPFDQRAQLMKRLTAAGIPDALADRVAKECGSATYLEAIYEECVDEDCKVRLLLPMVESVEISGLGVGSKMCWSEAIFRSFYSVHSDVAVAAKAYQNFQPLVTDQGELLCALHKDLDVEFALDSMLSKPKKVEAQSRRQVHITLCTGQSALLPKPTAKSFFTLEMCATQPLGAPVPSMVFRTISGAFCSPRIIVYIVAGSFFVNEVKVAMTKFRSDFVRAAKFAGKSILKACGLQNAISNTSRILLIIQGMSSGIEADAKTPSYRPQLKPLLDLVVADLILEHDVVVIQALRRNGDVEIILEQLALACFHYQLLTEKGRC